MDSSLQSTATDIPHADPWFEDGNVVLHAENHEAAFKVHRGLLSRHSEIFQSMFDIPQPPTHDGAEYCPVVQMYDSAWDLSNLIRALYDGVKFRTRGYGDFLYVASILRMATKYFVGNLRREAIKHLLTVWPNDLQGHDTMIEQALKAPNAENMTYPYVHPLHVLNLARETNARVILPSVMYYLTLYPLKSILAGDHPKLTQYGDHPGKPSSQLSATDLTQYTLMHQWRIDALVRFIKMFQGRPCCTANNMRGCEKSFWKLSGRLGRAWIQRTGPIHYILQGLDEVEREVNICPACRQSISVDFRTLRQELWDELPSVLELPPWISLMEYDLPPRPTQGPRQMSYVREVSKSIRRSTDDTPS